MNYDYEEVHEVVPERAVKYGSCCNLWTEVPTDSGVDLEHIRRRLRLAGFRDVTEYRFSDDRMMFLIRTVIDGSKGVSEFDLKQITKLTREVADGNRAPMRDPPRIFERLEDKIRRKPGTYTGDVVPATSRVLGALYEIELNGQWDERALLGAYIESFQLALDRHRKRKHVPPEFTEWQVVSLIRKFWADGDRGLFTVLLSSFEHDSMMDGVFEIGSGGAEAREEYNRKEWGPKSPAAIDPEAQRQESRAASSRNTAATPLGPKTLTSLAGLRAALRR